MHLDTKIGYYLLYFILKDLKQNFIVPFYIC